MLDTQMEHKSLTSIPFTQPFAVPGMIVVFYKDGDYSDPMPAIVYRVAERTLNLGVFNRDSYEVFPIPHARHRDDPLLFNEDMKAGGAWEYTHEFQEIQKLKARVEAMEKLFSGKKLG